MKRNVSVVHFKFLCNILISSKIVKEMPGSVASGTHCIYHTGLMTACCQQTCMTYIIFVCTVKKTPEDGKRNCPKRVEFYSKNKFEKLVHLVGFIMRIYHDARSSELKPRNTSSPKGAESFSCR